jgi:hypothetical protein
VVRHCGATDRPRHVTRHSSLRIQVLEAYYDLVKAHATAKATSQTLHER